jgi:hypothetical protein
MKPFLEFPLAVVKFKLKPFLASKSVKDAISILEGVSPDDLAMFIIVLDILEKTTLVPAASSSPYEIQYCPGLL